MPERRRKLILVTGPSGAGMSTASKALEDAGFEAIDNLPIRLVAHLLNRDGSEKPMSLGLDLRNRDFSADSVLELLSDLEQRDDISPELLFLDCSPEEILRRYSMTRRRHPIVEAPSLAEGIAHEIDMLQPLRQRADVLIDTSDLNPHELRAEVETWLAPKAAHAIAVQIQSFSYKRGLPRGADMVFDCRFLKNPHWEPALRPLDGRDIAVQTFVSEDARYSEFFQKVCEFIQFVLPNAQAEGKSYLTIAFGCSGGKHRSVTLTERLSADLAKHGWQVSKRHRELEGRQGKEAHT